MSDSFNYSILFNQAIQIIKSVRNPHATRKDTVDLKWNVVQEQVLFNFVSSEFEEHLNVVSAAKDISISCLKAIIEYLAKEKDSPLVLIDTDANGDGSSNTIFVFKDVQTQMLLLFKEIEECPFWKVKGKEPKHVQDLMKRNQVKQCKYVYLVNDYAYLQVVGYNDDETDPGRGYNVYSMKWFWETYFGEEECEQFFASYHKYMKEVNDYIGYIDMKSLTPNSLVNFRRMVENTLLKFSYDGLLEKTIKRFDKTYTLSTLNYEIIKEQFLERSLYLIMLGKRDYAESLITSEWLYSSMKSAHAIDLTVIGMGYFKAVEQLMFELVCLHKDENREIKKNATGNIQLTDTSIKNDKIDSTLGAMANFFKANLDIIRDEVDGGKAYIRETIFEYKDLRNGYFHKHNIHSWGKIEEIRTATFNMIFLLLGSHKLTDKNKEVLGMPVNDKLFDDYYRLCEYVNYHSNELFFINNGRAEDILVYACADMNTEMIDEEYIKYSGVYFKESGGEKRVLKITKDCLPKEIYLGKLAFAQAEMVCIKPVKVKKIFENGTFIGGSIVDERGFSF